MDAFVYVISFLILLRYIYVILKYFRTGQFKKRIYEGKTIIVAYTFRTILLISFLLSTIIMTKDISGDLMFYLSVCLFFALCISVPGTFLSYIVFWWERKKQKNRNEYVETIVEYEKEKYGDEEEYDKINLFNFSVPSHATINERFNELISSLTNEQIAFVHQDMYDSVSKLFLELFENDYFKILNMNDSIFITCEKINGLLRKMDIDKHINVNEIIKDDDDYIKQRRKDMIPTIKYDLNRINKYIKSSVDGYEAVLVKVYDKPNQFTKYLGLGKTSELDRLFDRLVIIPSSGKFGLYFNKDVKFDKLNDFFSDYTFDVFIEHNDNILIKSNKSDNIILSELYIFGEEYQKYIADCEEKIKNNEIDDIDMWKNYLENIKKFDSYYRISSKNETESTYIILLALYILYEMGDVLLYDENGVILDVEKLECLVVNNE